MPYYSHSDKSPTNWNYIEQVTGITYFLSMAQKFKHTDTNGIASIFQSVPHTLQIQDSDPFSLQSVAHKNAKRKEYYGSTSFIDLLLSLKTHECKMDSS